MSDCKKCELEPACFDEPMDNCRDYKPTLQARKEEMERKVREHDDRVRRQLLEWLINEEPEFRLWDALYNRKPSVDDVLAVFEEDGL